MSDLLKTERFGDLSFEKDDVLTFPEGIPGFESEHSWILIGEDDSIFKWLQSCNSPDVALPVVPALQLFPSYKVSFFSSDIEKIGSSDLSELGMLLVVSVLQDNPQSISVNMKAPILINGKNRQGFQFVVLNEGYSIRTPLSEAFETLKGEEGSSC